MTRGKITIVGAGRIGTAVAQDILTKQLGNVVLLDVLDREAKARASDIQESLPIGGHEGIITGTSSYSDTTDSDVVVITAGLAKEKNLSQDELINQAQVVQEIVQNVVKYSPRTHLLMVTDPVDVMAYVALMVSGLLPEKVLGLSVLPDTLRFRAKLALEIGISPEDVTTLAVGVNDEDVVLLVRHTFVGGIPVNHFISEERLRQLIDETRESEFKSRSGNTVFAPVASIVSIIESIIKDKKRILPVSVYLQGEYGVQGLYLGVPAILGDQGIERVIELDLTKEERYLVEKSVERAKKSVTLIKSTYQA